MNRFYWESAFLQFFKKTPIFSIFMAVLGQTIMVNIIRIAIMVIMTSPDMALTLYPPGGGWNPPTKPILLITLIFA